MSDIDYRKYSFKNYRKEKDGIRVRRGRSIYNYINYPVADNSNQSISPETENKTEKPVNNKETVIMPPSTNQNINKSFDNNSVIEDLRTKKKVKMTTKTRHTDIKRDIIAVMMVVICFTLTVVSADIISGGDIFEGLSEVFASMSDVPVYYAIEVGSYSDMESARAASDLYRNRNAAGYVINDGTYRVIAAVYENKDDANAIVEKLITDGLTATIYEIKGANVNYNQYGDIGTDLETAVSYCSTIYDKLYLVSNELDKGEITENDAKVRINTLHDETVVTRDILITKTNNYSSDETVMMVRAELTAYSAILENLNNENLERPSLLADIRYSYAMIVHSYCTLLRTIK